MTVWVWSRNVAVSAVHEGARLASESGRSPQEGVVRTREVLSDGIGGSGRRFGVEAGQTGDVISVMAVGTAPQIIPFLPVFDISVRADAFDEDAVLP